MPLVGLIVSGCPLCRINSTQALYWVFAASCGCFLVKTRQQIRCRFALSAACNIFFYCISRCLGLHTSIIVEWHTNVWQMKFTATLHKFRSSDVHTICCSSTHDAYFFLYYFSFKRSIISHPLRCTFTFFLWGRSCGTDTLLQLIAWNEELMNWQ